MQLQNTGVLQIFLKKKKSEISTSNIVMQLQNIWVLQSKADKLL